jgi:hypothetical protein
MLSDRTVTTDELSYKFDLAVSTNHRRPQDFAQIWVASDKSRQALDFQHSTRQ